MHPLFKQLLQVAVVRVLRVSPTHGVDAVVILGHPRPVVVYRPGSAGWRRAHAVASGQGEELPVAGKIADVQLVTLGGVTYVYVPIVHAAVNLDITDGPLGRVGRAVANNLRHPQDRLGAVPVLPHGGPGTIDGSAAQFPVCVQPEGIADHYHQPVLGTTIAVVLGSKGQILGFGQLGADPFKTSFNSGGPWLWGRA